MERLLLLEATAEEVEAVEETAQRIKAYREAGKTRTPPCLPLDRVAPYAKDPSRNHALHLAAVVRAKEMGVNLTQIYDL